MTNPPLLIGDIGGTNARFALSTNLQPHFQLAQTFQCADFISINDAIDAYLSAHNIKKLAAIYLAVAGPIIDGNVKLTNNHWRVETNKLKEKFGLSEVHLVNDFSAIALSLTTMTADNLLSIGGEWDFNPNNNFNVAAIGPGSGLGVSGLINNDHKITPIVTEGGHSGFAPETKLQSEIYRILQKKFDRISIEHVLSGPGLINIHQSLCTINSQNSCGLSAAQIASEGTQGDDEICHKTMDLFFEILGQVAGDIALLQGAQQGVFIAGGITQRYPEYLQRSNFRRGFENKGPGQNLMTSIPTWLIKRKNPGLVGCSVLAQKDTS